MAQTVSLWGATYSDVPSITVPSGNGTALFADPSPVTAVAADVAQGKYFIDSSGNLVEGTGSGGGGVTRENIVPQQTITASAGYNGLTSTAVLIEGEDYEYTVNGDTRLGTAVDVNGTLQLGDGDYYWYEQGGCFLADGGVMYFRTSAAGSYTVKVDKLTLSGGGGGSTLIEKTITQNGTYSAEDDNADGYSEVTVNVAGSSWTKVAETTYTVSTTSTSAATVATWATGHSELWTNEKWVYVRVRDTAGKRAGYFYGSDQFIMVYPTSATSTTVGGRFTIKCSTGGSYTAAAISGTTGYGVYADTIYSDGRIRIRSRYNTSSSLTVDGTYKVEVYLLDPPTGAPIFT